MDLLIFARKRAVLQERERFFEISGWFFEKTGGFVSERFFALLRMTSFASERFFAYGSE